MPPLLFSAFWIRDVCYHATRLQLWGFTRLIDATCFQVPNWQTYGPVDRNLNPKSYSSSQMKNPGYPGREFIAGNPAARTPILRG